MFMEKSMMLLSSFKEKKEVVLEEKGAQTAISEADLHGCTSVLTSMPFFETWNPVTSWILQLEVWPFVFVELLIN